MDSADDCIFIEPDQQASVPQTFWVNPKDTSFFDGLQYDIDSIVLVGNCDLTWLNPPWEFECRLDVEYASFLQDKKVSLQLFQHRQGDLKFPNCFV